MGDSVMKRLTRDKHTTTLDPNQEPAITIASGEELLVETWDAFMGVREDLDAYRPLGPATGPIYVEGASRGDALRVDYTVHRSDGDGAAPSASGARVPAGAV